MTIFCLTFQEIGLNPLIILIITVFSIFFIVSFLITSPNMDTKGLLRVLYSKPIRKSSGKVIYTKKIK